jgi:hypothetical protein
MTQGEESMTSQDTESNVAGFVAKACIMIYMVVLQGEEPSRCE